MLRINNSRFAQPLDMHTEARKTSRKTEPQNVMGVERIPPREENLFLISLTK